MKNFHSNSNMYIKDVTLMVSNIQDTLSFYQNIIGLKLIEQVNDHYHLGTHKDKRLLTLINNPLATPKMRTTGLYHFAILLPEKADLGHFIKHIISTKTKITGGADHGISNALYLDDPEGNGIEIYVDRKQSDWPPFDQVVNQPMDYEGFVQIAPETAFIKIPDDTIMGHIHLHVANMVKAREFFIGTLGFENTMQYGPHAAFVSDQGYHHHIGFNVWNGQDIPNNPENTVGLKAYTLYIPKANFNAVLSNIKNANIPIIRQDDRTYIRDINNVKLFLTSNL